MIRNVHRLVLTSHITVAVGWIGAVGACLVLGMSAMRTESRQVLRSAWIAMEAIGSYLIAPLACLAPGWQPILPPSMPAFCELPFRLNGSTPDSASSLSWPSKR